MNMKDEPQHEDLSKKKSKSTANLFKARREKSKERIITVNEQLKIKFLERPQELLDQPK